MSGDFVDGVGEGGFIMFWCIGLVWVVDEVGWD